MSNPQDDQPGLETLPSELQLMIVNGLIPPAGRSEYNISEFDDLTSIVAAGSVPMREPANSIWLQDFRHLRLRASEGLRSLNSFFGRIGNAHISTIRSVLIDLPQIPPLGKVLDGSFGYLIRNIFQNPDLARAMYVMTSSQAYMSQIRLQRYFLTLQTAVTMAVCSRRRLDTDAEFREKYLQWRKEEIERLKQFEDGL